MTTPTKAAADAARELEMGYFISLPDDQNAAPTRETLAAIIDKHLAAERAAHARELAEAERKWEVAARDAGLYCGTLHSSARQLECEECMVDYAVKAKLAELTALRQQAEQLAAALDEAVMFAEKDGWQPNVWNKALTAFRATIVQPAASDLSAKEAV